MPIRSYFAVVGPALTVFLWLLSSYLEPSTPVKPQSAATKQDEKPASASPIQARAPAGPIASATSQGASQAEEDLRKTALEPTRSVEPTKPSVQAAHKHKKQKQIANRRQRRDMQEIGRAHV